MILGIVWLMFAILLFPLNCLSQSIEGSSERYKFEPGDKVIYQSDLSHCPVGEFLTELKVARGSYECARFENRIWVRPLEHGTTLYMVLPQPLKNEFSLEFTVHSFEPGRPILRFALHPEDIVNRLERGDYYAVDDMVLVGGMIRVGDPSLFGAKDRPQGNLDGRWDFRNLIKHGKDHRIAIQVRRRQVRFFVDGKRIGHKPFTPGKPVKVLSLYFRRLVDVPQPFSDAPVLVRDIRIATYSEKEAIPEAEKDLIRDLGAVQTPEGLKVVLSEAILFDFGMWELKPEAIKTLEKVARLAQLRKGIVRIEGHTDNVGSEQFNLVLSELRAHVVALKLARLGVDAKRLMPKGFGETRPVAPNDSDANRAKNRRVEIVFTNQKTDDK